MSEVNKPKTPNGKGHVYSNNMGGYGNMQGNAGYDANGYGHGYPNSYGYGYGYGMPTGYGYGYQPNQGPVMKQDYQQNYGCYGYGGGWSSMGTILVLFILLVIISKTFFI